MPIPRPSDGAFKVARALVVSHTGAYGGAERSLLIQMRSDSADGEIDVALASPPGELADHARRVGISTYYLRGFEHGLKFDPRVIPRQVNELLRGAWELRQCAKRHHADVIHANSIRAGLVAVIARPMGGPPVITHVRDCLPPSMATRIIATAVGRGSAAVVANSEYTARSFENAGSGTVRVVYNALDETFREPAGVAASDLRQRLEIEPHAPVIAVVGQLTPWKQQDFALRVFARLQAEVPEARLVVVGDAMFAGMTTRFDNRDYADGLHRLPLELGIKNVVFTGRVSDSRPALTMADVLLMPSREEPFGRVAFEAMALGTAVISTNVGGPSEYITDGESGLLRDPSDADAWHEALTSLIENPELRGRMASAAQNSVRDNFFTDSPATRVAPIYREIAAI